MSLNNNSYNKMSREEVRKYADEQVERVFREHFGSLSELSEKIKNDVGLPLFDMGSAKDDLYYKLLSKMKEDDLLDEPKDRPVRAKPLVADAITECSYNIPSTPTDNQAPLTFNDIEPMFNYHGCCNDGDNGEGGPAFEVAKGN